MDGWTLASTDLGGGLTLVLAQAGQPEAGPGPAPAELEPGVPGSGPDQGITGQSGSAPPTGPTSLLGSPFVLVLGMLLIIVMTSVMGGRKDKKKRAEMMASLKRQDRVQTLGGIIGTIVELKDDEVVLRVDEGTNTRIRFARSAIQQILRESATKNGTQTESKPSEQVAV